MNLIQRGANVNELSGFLDKNPLHLACEYGHFSCARLLANSDNINLDSCGEYINGSTALHICAEFNQIDIMKMLVTKGANIEKLGRFSTIGTPLHIASLKGNIHAVNELIQLGANINSRDELNNTPLHVTAVIALISGVGFTNTVTVNIAPMQLPDFGITLYVAVLTVFVRFSK